MHCAIEGSWMLQCSMLCSACVVLSFHVSLHSPFPPDAAPKLMIPRNPPAPVFRLNPPTLNATALHALSSLRRLPRSPARNESLCAPWALICVHYPRLSQLGEWQREGGGRTAHRGWHCKEGMGALDGWLGRKDGHRAGSGGGAGAHMGWKERDGGQGGGMGRMPSGGPGKRARAGWMGALRTRRTHTLTHTH